MREKGGTVKNNGRYLKVIFLYKNILLLGGYFQIFPAGMCILEGK